MNEISKASSFKIETSALRAYTMLGALVLIWLFFHYATSGIFLTPRNLSNLMVQTSVTGVLAVGMLMVIVSGNIDLSVGSVLGLAGGVAAITLAQPDFLKDFVNLIPVISNSTPLVFFALSILTAVAVGSLIGLFHGVLVAYGKIPAFIVTLGGLLAWRGAIKGLSQSETVPVADQTFKAIGQAYITPASGWVIAALAVAAVLFIAYRRIQAQKTYAVENANPTGTIITALIQSAAIIGFIYVMNSYEGNGVPIPVLIWLVIALIGVFITDFTTFGRYLYAIGGNPDAARLSGINNERKILQVYALLGALTGVAALIFTARVGSASPDAGVLKELDAIAACVIGGASLMGGRGTIFGACLGALIMASLDNGMSLLNVSDFLQDIIKGSILVTAVGLDMIGRKQS